MSISRLTGQDANGTSTAASSVSATYASTPTANNLLIAVVGDTDGVNNATAISGWSQGILSNVGNSNEAWVFYKVATGLESTTVSATTSAATTACIAIYEYSGLVTSSPLDKSATGGSQFGAASFSTGTTAATTVANELVITGGFTSTATTFVSWSNSVNDRQNVSQTTHTLYTGDKIVSSTGTQTSTLTYNTNAGCSTLIITFSGLSGGTVTVKELSLLGIGS